MLKSRIITLAAGLIGLGRPPGDFAHRAELAGLRSRAPYNYYYYYIIRVGALL